MNSAHRPTVRLRDVSVEYGRRLALDGFSGSLEAGDWLGLIGPNGAGKSTLLRALAGLVGWSGTIEIDGVDTAGLAPRDRARLVAYVAQEPQIPDDMPVRDYVRLGRWSYAGRFGVLARRDRAIADEVIEELRLVDHADRLLGELSGGERQRAVLARALAQQAPVLVLDEPTSALDIGFQQQALELVSSLRAEHDLTVLSALHDLTLAGLYTDRLVLLDGGRIVADGTAAEVLTPRQIEATFSVRVDVEHGPEGIVVVPRRNRPRPHLRDVNAAP